MKRNNINTAYFIKVVYFFYLCVFLFPHVVLAEDKVTELKEIAVARAHFATLRDDPLKALQIFDQFEATLDSNDQRVLLDERLPPAQLVYARAALNYGVLPSAIEAAHAYFESGQNRTELDLLWLDIAKQYFLLGQTENALNSLDLIHDTQASSIYDDYHLLKGEIYLQLKQLESAIEVFESWKGNRLLKNYLTINIGVAYLGKNQFQKGITWLTKTANLKSKNLSPEHQALKDRANLYAGYAYLMLSKNAKARLHLEQVQLDSLEANKALLGLGWSDISRGQSREAVAPWQYLNRQVFSDPAVQESYLLLPFALTRVGALGKATNLFSEAVDQYSNELIKLESAKKQLTAGGFFKRVTQSHRQGGGDWLTYAKLHLSSEVYRYLIKVFTQDSYHAALHDYIDLDDLNIQSQAYLEDQTYQSQTKKLKFVQKDIQVLMNRYSEFMTKKLLLELEENITRLEEYRRHAQFALAESYDRLSKQGR